MSIENQERVINKKESMETQSEREMRKNTEEVCDILRTLDPEDPRVESLCAEWRSRWMARVAAEPENKRLPVYLNFLHARLDLESGKKERFFQALESVLDEINHSDYRDQLEDIRLRAVYLIKGPDAEDQ